MLDELDKELERRGHRFVRYADDSNLYVKSERAGRRVMESVSHFILQRLKLRVNAAKSAVDRPQQRTFLGFTFTGGKNPARRKLAPKALARFKAKVRERTRRTWGISLEERIQRLARYLNGWREYYGYCETPAVLRDLAPPAAGRAVEAVEGVQAAQGGIDPSRRRGSSRHDHDMECQRTVADVSYDGRATRTPRLVLRHSRVAQINRSPKHATQPNRRGTDPYARWCGRREVVRLPPIPIGLFSGLFAL